MRRPGPLPPPSTAVNDANGTAGDLPPSGRTGTAVKKRPEVSPAAGAPAEASAGDVVASITVRDVWRAARARRKALRDEVRRFTVRQRRRRAVWLGSVSAVVIVAVATVAAAYSPLFAVEDITVAGTSQLDADAVQDALADQLGTPLPSIDDSAIQAALIGFPLVESYTLEARPPHQLVVRIVERTPIGVISSRAGFTLVDAAGVALATTPTAPDAQALIAVSGGVQSRAFAAVGRVMRTLPPDIRTQVTAVSATTADDVTLTLGSTRSQVVWGGAGQSAKKALALQAMMTARPPASVSVYDVSSPTAVVVR